VPSGDDVSRSEGYADAAEPDNDAAAVAGADVGATKFAGESVNAESIGILQSGVDDVVPLEARLDVPIAVLLRHPRQRHDRGEAGREHANRAARCAERRLAVVIPERARSDRDVGRRLQGHRDSPVLLQVDRRRHADEEVVIVGFAREARRRNTAVCREAGARVADAVKLVVEGHVGIEGDRPAGERVIESQLDLIPHQGRESRTVGQSAPGPTNIIINVLGHDVEVGVAQGPVLSKGHRLAESKRNIKEGAIRTNTPPEPVPVAARHEAGLAPIHGDEAADGDIVDEAGLVLVKRQVHAGHGGHTEILNQRLTLRVDQETFNVHLDEATPP